ncbi:hypothetical protein PMAYCL1PPCAC_27265, partial [Pristionchus mayeri]
DYSTCDNDASRMCFTDSECSGGRVCSYGPGGSYGSMGCCTAKPQTGGIIDYSTCDNDISRSCFDPQDCAGRPCIVAGGASNFYGSGMIGCCE